jgi:Carboxypeptidase regulatory-like domain/TonB dependent receptor-like, beta-barrel
MVKKSIYPRRKIMRRAGLGLGKLYLCALGFALVLSLVPTQARGQGTISGAVTGLVTDSTGGAVPSATVRATNVSTNVSTDTLTNNAGLYRILSLIPGTYTISAEKSGFKKFIRENVVVSVGTVVRVNATLEVGAVTQTVTVTGAPPVLQAETADVSQTLGSRQIENLPTLGRNITRLVQLAPGATMAPSQLSGWPENAGNDFQTNINGQVGLNSNRQLDGVDNNETIQGLSMVVPTDDSVQEMRVTTSDYDAEYGQVAGAVIQISTKSGTNDWHGSLFDFYRSSGMFARNPFTEPKRPASFVWQQYGGSSGGPIVKDKLFVFGDYQGVASTNGASVLTTVPTAAFRNGDFSALAATHPIFDPATGNPDGSGRSQFVASSDPSSANYNPACTNAGGCPNIIPLSRISTVATKLLSFLPAPTDPTKTDLNFLASGGGVADQNQFSSRVDYNLSSKSRLFVRYSLFHARFDVPGAYGDVGGAPLGGIISGHSTALNQSLLANYTRTWSPSLLSDFRFGLARAAMQNTTNNATLHTASDIGMAGINITGTELTNGIPDIGVGGPVGGFDFSQGLPFLEFETNVHVMNNWTKISGNHTLKWGVDIGKAILRRRDTSGFGSENVSQNVTGSATVPGSGLGMASFLLGLPSSYSRIITLQIVPDKQWRDGLYFEDQWAVSRKVTATLGLRWDYFSPEFSDTPEAGKANIANLDTTTGDIILGGYNGDKYDGVTPVYNEFGPRLGLAYRLTKDTVFRAGFGRSHAIDGAGANLGRVFRNWPLQQSQTFTAATAFVPVFTFEQGPSAPAAIPPFPSSGLVPMPNGNFYILYPGTGPYRHPEIDSWNVTLQHQLWGNTTLQVAYVGSVGRHLVSQVSANAAVPGPGPFNPRRPFFSKFGWTQLLLHYGDVVHSHSNYQALQATFEKHFSHDLFVLSNFTWDKSLDLSTFEGANGIGGGTQNQFDPESDWGNSDESRNLISSTSFLWGLPFGPGKLVGSHFTGIPRQIIEGWKINGVVSLMSGAWFTPFYSDTSGYNSDCCTLRPDRIGSGQISNPGRNLWFDPSAFTRPPNYTYGNSGRNILQGPGWADADLALFKQFQITEKVNLQLRLEAYNAFNRTNLAQPNRYVDSSTAGVISGTVYNMRRLQIGAHLSW